MNNGLVFVISGPSGSGKGTVVEILRKIYSKVGVAVSATSRLPREGELEGVNYYYKTREQFEELIRNGDVLEYTEYNGNYYGTLKSEAERITAEGRDIILEIEVDGGSQIKKLLGEQCVTIMLIAPDADEQERRLRGRGTESEEVILGRLARAREEMMEAVKYDYVVVNETGKSEECAETIVSIMKAEHQTSRRMSKYINDYFD
ncbi:MAG: guanylate kinase [Ruminococcaceae bacterium]|nr:guanylate kinase [Oscillospiraceae bacterium]